MEEKELFQDYELKSWELSPRIYKILGIAAAVHLFSFIVLGQFDLIGTKACDSPYVGKVCQVLDAAYVGSVLLGTDTEFSSRDYDKTEISEADVTWVDVGNQFNYPPGYFDISNPAPQMIDPTMMPIDPTTGMPMSTMPGQIPGISTSPMTLDPNQPAIVPTPNPNAVQGTTPDSPFTFGGGNKTTVNRPPPRRTQKFTIPNPKNTLSNNPLNPNGTDSNTQTANKDKNLNANTTANKDDKTKTETPKKDDEKLFNRKPLEDFGAKYANDILKNEVDINAPFTIEVIADLDENGKLVNPKMAATSDSDPKMTELAKEAILAFGDSQLLLTLYKVGGRKVRITFAQDKDNLQAMIKAETKSENEAKRLLSGLNLYLKNFYKPKEDSDEAALLQKAGFATDKNNLVINFLISNDEKTAMIRRNLEKIQEKIKNEKPNSGVAETTSKDIKSAK